MRRKRMPHSVIDPITGHEVDTIKQGDRIVREESLDAFREMVKGKTQDFNRGATFVKVYDDGMRKIRKHLTNAQFSFICHLLPQIEFDTNIIRNDNGTLMEIPDMTYYTGMTYISNYKLITVLIARGIVGKWETGSRDEKGKMLQCFVVNPYIFHKGTMIPNGLMELFSKSGWKDE